MRKAITVFGNTVSILLATISLYMRSSADSTFKITSSPSLVITSTSTLSRLASTKPGTGKNLGAVGEVVQ